MAQRMKQEHYDVVVVGGGAAGVAAAAGAAKNGAKTLLIDAGPIFGGELLSGMSIDGALNAREEYVVGGIARELFDECQRMNGLIGPLHDYRLICYVCVDPEVMKIAVMNVLGRYNVTPLLYTLVEDVVVENGAVKGVVAVNKGGRTLVTADAFIDCSGDGDVAALAGAPFEYSDASGDIQPLSLMFRMSGVENEPLLAFVRDNPQNCALGESEYVRGSRTDAELAMEIYKQGQPCVFFKGNGPMMANAIEAGVLFPTALIMIMPTSEGRKEVCINATRVANNIDGTQSKDVSAVMGTLMEQVWSAVNFLKSSVPGFKNAHFAGIAPRIGIRETRRIMGEYVLTGEDVLAGRKQKDVIAKGSHHIDIHQEGIKQVRQPVANGGSFDIPFNTLIPQRLTNVLVAGRCLSSDRGGQGSARMMGPCLGMGEAAGTAGAMLSAEHLADFRNLSVPKLQAKLKEQGAVLDGTY